jgi:polysaccharide export outer membrane protein
MWRTFVNKSSLCCWVPVLVLAASALVVNVRAQDASASDPRGQAQRVDANEYTIGPDDVLNISILDVPELSGEFRVSNGGKITLPMLDHSLDAAGLTLNSFSAVAARELKSAGLVTNPHVTTSVVQSRLHAVAITGAVNHPQIYPVFSQTTLLDMLSQAEGLAVDASGIAVIHRGPLAQFAAEKMSTSPGESVLTVDVKHLLEASDAKSNIVIYPGDRITVPRAGVFYVVGAVNKPGGFPMKPSSEGTTVLQALALAEDTKYHAIRDKSMIIRKDPFSPDGHKQIPVALTKILNGHAPDLVLQTDDVLFIPDSTGRQVLKRGVEALLQTTTGLVIYRVR